MKTWGGNETQLSENGEGGSKFLNALTLNVII